jgi:hypothetical protein
MMRVRGKPDDAPALELVGKALHVLTGQAHVPGNVGHRQRDRRQGDRADNLPSGAGEPEIANQGVACSEQVPVEAKDLEDQFGDGGMSYHGTMLSK